MYNNRLDDMLNEETIRETRQAAQHHQLAQSAASNHSLRQLPLRLAAGMRALKELSCQILPYCMATRPVKVIIHTLRPPKVADGQTASGQDDDLRVAS
jgi:hypothetical protein